MISRSLISSLQMKKRTLSSLSTLENYRSINVSFFSTLLDAIIREIRRSLFTNNELPPLFSEMLLSTQLNPVTITFIITMLTSESRRITSKNMSITIRNEFKVSNGHQILSLMERNKFLSNEIFATRAEHLIVQRSLYLRSLNRNRYPKKTYGSSKTKCCQCKKNSRKTHTKLILQRRQSNCYSNPEQFPFDDA